MISISGLCPNDSAMLDARDVDAGWIVCDNCALDVDANVVDWTMFASEPARDASDDAIVVTRVGRYAYDVVAQLLLVNAG